MPSITNTVFTSLVNVFFPHVCAGCEQPLSRGEEVVCVHCLDKLPATSFGLAEENPIENLFTGRVAIEAAMACYFFHKAAVLQNIIHQLKYHGRRDIGRYMGEQMGHQIAKSNLSHTIDGLVPVPLFYTKEKKRGYNQATLLCEGMAEVLQLPLFPKALKRIQATESQTHKTRLDRWENVKSAFRVEKPELLEGKHLLLVDDVITTGATLEACAQYLLEIPGTRVSIAALAMAGS